MSDTNKNSENNDWAKKLVNTAKHNFNPLYDITSETETLLGQLDKAND